MRFVTHWSSFFPTLPRPRFATLHVSVDDERGEEGRVRAVVAPALLGSPTSVMAPVHEPRRYG